MRRALAVRPRAKRLATLTLTVLGALNGALAFAGDGPQISPAQRQLQEWIAIKDTAIAWPATMTCDSVVTRTNLPGVWLLRFAWPSAKWTSTIHADTASLIGELTVPLWPSDSERDSGTVRIEVIDWTELPLPGDPEALAATLGRLARDHTRRTVSAMLPPKVSHPAKGARATGLAHGAWTHPVRDAHARRLSHVWVLCQPGGRGRDAAVVANLPRATITLRKGLTVRASPPPDSLPSKWPSPPPKSASGKP